jgi:hypothetical protein
MLSNNRNSLPFEFFENSNSLFQTIEKEFPIADRIKDFHHRMNSSINKEKAVKLELDRINNVYFEDKKIQNTNSGLICWEGYMRKIDGRDCSLFELDVFFLMWKAGLTEIDHATLRRFPNDLSKVIDPEGSLKQRTERRFLELLSMGINDAIFEKELLSIGLKPQNEQSIPVKSTDNKKLKWRGNSKQFAELIDQLQRKEWIDEFNNGELSSMVRSLCNAFDIPEPTLLQYLKPSERDDQIYTKRYKRSFESIQHNPEKKSE